VSQFRQTATALCFETSSMTYWCRGRRSAESRVGAILLRREHKVEHRPSSSPPRITPRCSSASSSVSGGGNRWRGRRRVTAVVICRAKSSSVASASLAPSSRSGQATLDAS
jgi:hypothetical protein